MTAFGTATIDGFLGLGSILALVNGALTKLGTLKSLVSA